MPHSRSYSIQKTFITSWSNALKTFVLFSIFLGLIQMPQLSLACSAFYLGPSGHKLIGKSYDWYLSHGYAIVNKRGVAKTSLQLLPSDKPFSWVSKYGSLSFNQYGWEFPLGGMNEKGLVLEVLWLNSSQYPNPNSQASVNELQWIQYHLDNSRTIGEMIENSKAIRVSPVVAEVHYFACDAYDDCAVFEYIDGELMVHSTDRNAETMTVPSITNNTYDQSMNYAREYEGFGGQKGIPTSSSSLDRFVRASHLAKTFDGLASSTNYAFSILDSVATGSYSKWNLVYDIENKSVTYKGRFGNRQTLSFNLNDLNFDCRTDVKATQIIGHDENINNAGFENMTRAKNMEMIRKSLAGQIPESAVQKAAQYPFTTRCTL